MMDLSVLESLFMNLNEGRFKVVSMYIDELQMYLLESIVELENKNIYSCNCEIICRNKTTFVGLEHTNISQDELVMFSCSRAYLSMCAAILYIKDLKM